MGFLSPIGKFYVCNHFEHIKLADELLYKFFGVQSNNPVDVLCKRGWVVIQESFIGFSDIDAVRVPKLTKEQKDWLYENEFKMTYAQREGLKLCLELNSVLYD